MKKFLSKSILGIALLSCGATLSSCLKVADLDDQMMESLSEEEDKKDTTSDVNREEVVISIGDDTTNDEKPDNDGEGGGNTGGGGNSPGVPYDEKFLVTFIFGHDLPDYTQELRVGETIEYPEAPTVMGYTFDSWDRNITVMPAQNIVFTARWIENTKYTATFVMNNDMDDNVVKTFYVNQEIEFPDEPTRYGYTFTGWDKNITVMPAEDVVFTATWQQAKEYTVSFKYGYGTSQHDTIWNTKTYEGEAIRYPTAEYMAGKRTNYKFEGWDYNEVKMPSEDLVITAKWKYDLKPGVYTNEEILKVNPTPAFSYETACSKAFNIDENGHLTRIGELPAAVANSSLKRADQYIISFPNTVKSLAPEVFATMDYILGVDLRGTQITGLSENAFMNNFAYGNANNEGKYLNRLQLIYLPGTLNKDEITYNLVTGLDPAIQFFFDADIETARALKQQILVNATMSMSALQYVYFFYSEAKGYPFASGTRV